MDDIFSTVLYAGVIPEADRKQFGSVVDPVETLY